MQEVFSLSPSLPLFFSPIAHSVRKSVSVSKPLRRILSALRTLWDLGQLVLVWLSSCKGFISFSFHTV